MSHLAAQEDLKKSELIDKTLSLEEKFSHEVTEVSVSIGIASGEMLGMGREAELAPTENILMS